MTGNLSHQEIQELLGAFALDAVDDDERDVIEAHLAGCPRCRAEVEDHRETAALLAHSGERAPEGVWDRIAEALDEAPPALDITRITPEPAPRSISLRVAAAAVAVAATVALLLGVILARDDTGLDRFDRALDALEEATLAGAAQVALSNPAAEQIELTSATGKARARLVRLPDGTGYLIPTDLGRPPAGRVYQLWAVRQDAKISLGVLGAEPRVAAFRMTGPVVAFAITEEEPGGVGATENQPLLVGHRRA